MSALALLNAQPAWNPASSPDSLELQVYESIKISMNNDSSISINCDNGNSRNRTIEGNAWWPARWRQHVKKLERVQHEACQQQGFWRAAPLCMRVNMSPVDHVADECSGDEAEFPDS